MTIRVVIADDEALARRKLRGFLAKHDDVECIGDAVDGDDAVRLVNALRPDVLFLDIRMPGASGLEVMERVETQSHVVFTTAYDKYAVTAFELHALDYLLKPFGEDRLRRTLDRVRSVLQEGVHDDETFRGRRAFGEEQSFEKLFVRKRGHIVPINIADIHVLIAGDEYVTLQTANEKFLVSLRLRDMEQKLDPARFVRVHRSYIVNLDHVRAMTPFDGARLQIELANGTLVVASRTRSKDLRKRVI